MKQFVMMKALAYGTVGGAFGIIHVDPDNEEAKIVKVTEAGAVALEKKGLAKRVRTKIVDEDDEETVEQAAARRLQDADHGDERINTGGDTRDTTAFQKDPLTTGGFAPGDASAPDADAPPAGPAATGDDSKQPEAGAGEASGGAAATAGKPKTGAAASKS